MKRRYLAPILLALALPASAVVTVTHGDIDKFTDAGDWNHDPQKAVEELSQFLVQMGDKYLAPGRGLRIEILDLDRAGRSRMRVPTDVRIMTNIDIPCMDLRYTLESDGKAGEARRERVCDRDYLRPLGPRFYREDPLVYEKRMLDEWFRERFAK